ncbi:phenylacetate--CoA ligase family protein [Ferrimonas pelagia]|uniref:AMP-dependent synthetase/ligase domain-containing protein n=1 Tax=Ferrimonas pelagia TaxID=1177826 RepID=A0ABP9EHA8_9GAMM
MIPAGPGQTELQLAINAQLQPQGYCGTPSFLNILLEKAQAQGQRLSFRHALVTGEALPPALRQRFSDAGMDVLQAYASADIGLIGYESWIDQGLSLDEELLVEIVRPGSGEPVESGEIGEVVVTRFDPEYPLIRFATGDLSSWLSGTSPCGRTNLRLRGWQGRADQSAKVKGLFVHPAQLEALRVEVGGMARIRAVITQQAHQDQLTLLCEAQADTRLDLDRIVAQARAVLRLGVSVDIVPSGSLPRDSVVIEDQRS